jgi:hypothetical protein
VGEVAPRPADLPDALVGLAPVLAEPAEDLLEALPQVVVEGGTVLVVEICSVENSPVEVELALGVGSISEPHG